MTDGRAPTRAAAAAIALVVVLGAWLALGVGSARATITPISASTGTNLVGSSLTINKPASVTSGEVLLATVVANGTGAITAPSGWTQIQNTVTGQRQVSYYRVTTTSEPSSWTWTLGSVRVASGGIAAYSGVNTVSPIDASAVSSGASGAAVAPSVTTYSSGDRVLATVSFGPTTLANSVTPDASTTERYDVSVATGTESEAADFTQATAGPTSTKSATPARSAAWIAHTIALNDAANAGLSVATLATPTFSASLATGDQTTSYTMPLTVQDTRTGSAAASGWNLTVTSTPFTSGSHALSSTASRMTGVTDACAAGGAACRVPTNGVSYPLAVPAGMGPPPAAKMFNAASATGTGALSVTPTIEVTVPGNSFAGSYTSTVTLTLISGP